MRYTIIFCLFPLFLNAQLLRRTGELSRFSLEIDGGRLSSFAMFNYYCFDCCDVGCFGITTAYYEPVQTTYFSLKTMLRLGKRHQLGFGGIFSQKGFSGIVYPRNSKFYTYDSKEDYAGLSIIHNYRLLNGQRFNMGIGNEIQFDFHLYGDGYSTLYKHGLSHQASLNLGWDASKHLELKLKTVARTALSKYGDDAFDGPFHRFGTGLFLGMEYRLGKVTYHANSKH